MTYTINSFETALENPTNVTPNMSAYVAEQDGDKWVEVDGWDITDQEGNDDYTPELNELHELRDQCGEMLFELVENICNEAGIAYEKIKDNTGDAPNYYYHITDKSAFLNAARKYVADNA
jgi:DNA mismatch repair ATPase MutS